MRVCRPIAAALLLATVPAAVTGCTAWTPAHTAYRPAAPHAANLAAALPPPPVDLSDPARTIIRGQNTAYPDRMQREAAGSEAHLRERMPVWLAQYTPPAWGATPPGQALPPSYPPPPGYAQPGAAAPAYPPPAQVAPMQPPPAVAPPVPLTGPATSPFGSPFVSSDPVLTTPVDVFVQETQTGRFMFGAGINSDAGVTGQIVIDERNFDITRVPTSPRDFLDGTAFRGAGQGFRIEAMPGNRVQRYLVSFTEPYFLDTPISLNLSGFLFDRRYFDWDEQRLGGRVALGYRLTPDLSVAGALRAENVKIRDVRVMIPQLAEVMGNNALYSGRWTVTHDTRDLPFFPTEGHLIELSFEQVFGDFVYPRGEVDYRRYFLIRERPDGSGRHTLANTFQVGISGQDTPVFENYFAGGYSTLRGFGFRGASPVVNTVRVGGRFKFLGSTEYTFPLTADDMLKGAFFVDYGTIEEQIRIRADNFRVAPGFGVRISVPALGPAPLAFDFAFPVARADTDETRVFSFFFGMGR